MSTSPENAYQLDDLGRYTFGQRLAIRAIASVFYVLIHAIGGSVRFEAEGLEHLEAAERDGPPIFAVWHDRILLGTYYLRGRRIVVLTSQSFDGEYIARFLRWFGYGAIRGSSTRGGTRGLAQMVRGIEAGLPMAFTVDGPTGPRYVAKPGPVALAAKTGRPILPLVVESKRFWRVKSWDRLQIPRPFTRAKIIFDEPMFVGEEEIDRTDALAELQSRLERLNQRGEEWRSNLGQRSLAGR